MWRKYTIYSKIIERAFMAPSGCGLIKEGHV